MIDFDSVLTFELRFELFCVFFCWNLRLQHHCRCCGRTLCHEHSSFQMVFFFFSSSLIDWFNGELIYCDLIGILCVLVCVNLRPCRSLVFIHLLEFVLTVLITPLSKSCLNLIIRCVTFFFLMRSLLQLRT